MKQPRHFYLHIVDISVARPSKAEHLDLLFTFSTTIVTPGHHQSRYMSGRIFFCPIP